MNANSPPWLSEGTGVIFGTDEDEPVLSENPQHEAVVQRAMDEHIYKYTVRILPDNLCLLPWKQLWGFDDLGRQ